MKTKGLIIAILILASSQLTIAQNVNINGFARNYTGMLYNTGEFNMLQNTLNVNFEKMGDRVSFKANPLIYIYDIDSIDFRMREIYLDLYFDNFDIRIGKQ